VHSKRTFLLELVKPLNYDHIKKNNLLNNDQLQFTTMHKSRSRNPAGNGPYSFPAVLFSFFFGQAKKNKQSAMSIKVNH